MTMLTSIHKDRGAVSVCDFDGNIFKTQTPIYLRNKITKKIEEIPAHETDQNPEKYFGENSDYEKLDIAFVRMLDVYPHDSQHQGFDQLPRDIKIALNNGDFAPSFKFFKKIILKKAEIFSILTARGNSPDNFERVFHDIVHDVLTKEEKEEMHMNLINNYFEGKKINFDKALYYYLSEIASYIPCTNPHVAKALQLNNCLTAADRKAKAFDFIMPHYQGLIDNLYPKMNYPLSVGFSDDSVSNIVAVYNKMQEIYIQKPQYNMSVLFTGLKEKRSQLLDLINHPPYEEVGKKNDILRIKIHNTRL